MNATGSKGHRDSCFQGSEKAAGAWFEKNKKVLAFSDGMCYYLFSSGHFGRIPEWPKGTDCKSAAERFGGSNPPPPIFPPTGRRGGTGRRPGLKIP